MAKDSRAVTSGTQNYDDEPDETILERLTGLTEMFPEPVRNIGGKIVDLTVRGISSGYALSCSACWFFFSSSAILFAPIIFETERAQMQELQKTQTKHTLLGPGAVMQ